MDRSILLVLALGLMTPVAGALGNPATLPSTTSAGALVRVYQDDFEGDSLSPDWEVWPDGPQTVGVSDGELHLDASGTAFPWVWTRGWGETTKPWGIGRGTNGDPPLLPYRFEFVFRYVASGSGDLVIADSYRCQAYGSAHGLFLVLLPFSSFPKTAHLLVSTDAHLLACGWTGHDYYLELDGAVLLRGIPVGGTPLDPMTPPLGDGAVVFGGLPRSGSDPELSTDSSLFVDRVTLFVGATSGTQDLEPPSAMDCQLRCDLLPTPGPAPHCIWHLNPLGGGGGFLCTPDLPKPPAQRQDTRCVVDLGDPTNPNGGCEVVVERCVLDPLGRDPGCGALPRPSAR